MNTIHTFTFYIPYLLHLSSRHPSVSISSSLTWSPYRPPFPIPLHSYVSHIAHTAHPPPLASQSISLISLYRAAIPTHPSADSIPFPRAIPAPRVPTPARPKSDPHLITYARKQHRPCHLDSRQLTQALLRDGGYPLAPIPSRKLLAYPPWVFWKARSVGMLRTSLASGMHVDARA